MESNAQYIDFLCRTCMNKVEASSHDGTTKPQQWLSIFDTIEECGALGIAELLSDAVPQIVVQPSDELPKKICTECLQLLLSVYWFQKMCVQSDKEMHELLSKERTALNSPMLKAEIKGETETNDPDSEPLKDLPCNSTLQNLPRPSIQEPLAEVTVQTIEPEAAQSIAEHCNNSQGAFEEFIKNEPIEDDAANSEYSDGDTIHSTISVTKEEVLPIEFEDQQVNDALSRYNCHLCNKSYKRRKYLIKHLNDHKKKANNIKVYCYACHLCSESYKKEWILARHLTREHSKDLQRYTCDVCNKSFAASSGLRKHIRTHTAELPNMSPECEKSFTAQRVPAQQRTTYADDKPYECPYCPVRFSSKRNASRHQAIHEGIKPHKCNICGKKFRLMQYLTKHKRIHSKEKPHKCDICERRFAQMQQLKDHIRTHTGEKPYKCKYCEYAFVAISTLHYHLRSHLGKNSHRCKLCPLAFRSNAEMRLHFTSHKNEDPEVRERNLKALQEEEAKLKLKFSKEISKGQSTEEQQQEKLCNKEIAQQSIENLAQHRLVHTKDKAYECNERPHKCDVCEKRFVRSQHLKVHMRTHTGEKPHKCKYCERAFTTFVERNRHLRSHLGKNIHRCKFCPLAFPSYAEMLLHLTSHKNEDPETRELNLKALQQEEAKVKQKILKEKTEGQSAAEQPQQKLSKNEIEQQTTDIPAEQRTTHAEDKPYECPYCPLRFSSKRYASIHQTIHEGIKPHNCGICEKKFRRKCDLKRHKRIHSKEKQHKCDICERRFTQMQELKVHIRKHTGEKPYKCKYCERAFAERGTLTNHLRNHLGKNIHRCKFCPLAFPSYAETRLHLTSHKNEDPELRERNLKALQEEEAK